MIAVASALADPLTPSTLTADEILDAVSTGIATDRDGWDACAEAGTPGRDEARRRICLALAKQRGGGS